MPNQGVRIGAGPQHRYSNIATAPGPVDEIDDEGRATESTKAVTFDTFARTVVAPTIVQGTLITAALGTSYQAKASATQSVTDGTFIPNAFQWHTPIIKDVAGYLGIGYWAHTFRPSWGECSGSFDNLFYGWAETERWQLVTIPAHPGNMAGMQVDVKVTGGTSIVYSYGCEVVVMSTQPTDVRQGTPVGTIPNDGAWHTMTIPVGEVGDEGTSIYIGVRPKWQVNKDDWACGWTWPRDAGESQLSHNGDPWLGYSGRAITLATQNLYWMVETGAGDAIGNSEGGGEWGVFEWQEAGGEGNPDWGVDDDGLYIETTDPAEKGWFVEGADNNYEADETQDELETDTEAEESVDDEETVDAEEDPDVYGPWSDQKGSRVDIHFSIDAAGLTGQAGTRELEVVIVGQEVRASAKAHLGDGDFDAGVSADGGGVTAFADKTIAADTVYVLTLDTRAERARAKVFPLTTRLGEQAYFDVDVELAETTDDGDRMELWLRAGNVVSQQRLTVHKIVAYESGEAGDTVVYELVGSADGMVNRFPTAHRATPGSIRAGVAGIGALPVSEEDAHFSLDLRPTSGSIVRVRYVIASDDDDDDED